MVVEDEGFNTLTTKVFRVDVGARERVDATLDVQGSTQSVTVTGADSVAVVESDSSDRGQVVEAHEIVNRPLNGRNYSDLALLAPGVTRSALSNQTNTSREGSFNVNGVRSTLNNFVLDGLDNNSYSFDNNTYSNQAVQVSPDVWLNSRSKRTTSRRNSDAPAAASSTQPPRAVPRNYTA